MDLIDQLLIVLLILLGATVIGAIASARRPPKHNPTPPEKPVVYLNAETTYPVWERPQAIRQVAVKANVSDAKAVRMLKDGQVDVVYGEADDESY